MYEFVRGPLVWIAFIVFVGGTLYKLVQMIVCARREKVVLPTMDARFGLRSLVHWLVPFATRNMRLRPLMTIVSYLFHVCLLLTPLLVVGHAVLWEESWGVSWWSLPEGLAHLMTLVVIVAVAFFMLRRLVAPEVRNVTQWSDYLLLLVVVAPFVTGFIAHQQWLSYQAVIILHIISGALWLMVIPFTWLSHMFYFFFTRSYMGSEFGAVRRARDW